MTHLIIKRPKILSTFLAKFKPVFTAPAFTSFCIYTTGLFIEQKRTSIQSITSHTAFASYQNTQYFISEARWDHEHLNDMRLALLQSRRTTASSPRGVLIIDDTGCKKWGFKTDGAQIQHYGTEHTQTRCNIVVFSAYADYAKRYPINLKPYIPATDPAFDRNSSLSFKSKLELAYDLTTDALKKTFHFVILSSIRGMLLLISSPTFMPSINAM